MFFHNKSYIGKHLFLYFQGDVEKYFETHLSRKTSNINIKARHKKITRIKIISAKSWTKSPNIFHFIIPQTFSKQRSKSKRPINKTANSMSKNAKVSGGFPPWTDTTLTKKSRNLKRNYWRVCLTLAHDGTAFESLRALRNYADLLGVGHVNVVTANCNFRQCNYMQARSISRRNSLRYVFL